MFTRIQPEAAGVRSEGIVRFLDDMRAKRLHMHDMMILRHGQVIAEASFAPWSKDNLHMLYSLSKSFTSTAVGFAVQEGLLKLTDRVVDFFPEYLPAAPCENMRKMTVRHLLTMNTGHEVEPPLTGDCWEQTFLTSYVPFEPGTHFLYNTAATYMLSCIVQKVTGKKLLAWLREKLMDPLGMSPDAWFEESPTGVATGGFGLNVRVEDVARLGQFYLQRGAWDGVQLLDPQWIRDAQTPWSDNSITGNTPDWVAGYGYQFWMCQPDNVFRGDGAFGQYCVIMPDQDMVVAINSGVEDMQAVLQSLWDNLLPAVGEPCPPTGALEARLRDTATPARWEDMERDVAAPVPDEGWRGRYAMQRGNALGLTAVEVRADALALWLDGEENALPLCRDAWQSVELRRGKNGRATSNRSLALGRGEEGVDPLGYMRSAAVRAARRGDALVVHLCYVNTPFEDVLKFTFTPHGVRLEGHRNAGFNATAWDLTGVRE